MFLGMLNFERSLGRALEERRNRAFQMQLYTLGEISDFFECEEPRLRVERMPCPPFCRVEVPPRTFGRDDPQHDTALGTRDARRLTQEPFSVVGETECNDHEYCPKRPVLEGQSLPQRPKCLNPTPLRVQEGIEGRVDSDVNPQGFSEPSRSNANLEPRPREVTAQLLQAEQLRRKEYLSLFGVKPRVVVRGLAFEYPDPAQIDVSFATL